MINIELLFHSSSKSVIFSQCIHLICIGKEKVLHPQAYLNMMIHQKLLLIDLKARENYQYIIQSTDRHP